MLLKTVLDKTADIIYPPKCTICDTLMLNDCQKYVCKDCETKIYFNQPPYCTLCGTHLSNTKKICKICKQFLSNPNHKIWYDKIISVFLYKDTIKDILITIKYNNHLKLSEYIGNEFAKLIEKNSLLKEIDFITFVPLHPKKLFKRGFNQSKIFAGIISKRTQINMIPNLLIRKKFTKPQSELSRNKRFENVKDAFSINLKYNIKNTNILIIDDIFTTGATVNECAKTLKNENAKHIKIVTLARGK